MQTNEIQQKQPVLRRKDYDIWLVGRSYAVFRRAIKTERTLEFYRRNLCYFLAHVKLTTEQIVEQFGPYLVMADGEHRPNLQGQIALQRLVEGYVLYLSDRVDRSEIKPTSVVTLVPAIKLFLDMNDILLNWKKINKLLPRSDLVADDEAYSRDDIQKMLRATDLRGRVIILLLASSGMRLEGLTGLKVGDITPMYDPADSKRVVAAHLKVYARTESEYNTFATPEAWDCFSEYLRLRKSWGEDLNPDSPAVITRFGRHTFSEGRSKAIDSHTVQDMMIALRRKVGLDKKSKHYNNRYSIKSVHGFRKAFLTALKSVKTPSGQFAIDYTSREKLLGHRLVGQIALEMNYDRREMIQALLQDYLRAVHALTLGDEARLALQVTKLEKDVTMYKTLDVTVAEKDRQIRELQSQMEAMKESQDEIRELLKHPERLAELLKGQ